MITTVVACGRHVKTQAASVYYSHIVEHWMNQGKWAVAVAVCLWSVMVMTAR
jgi:hypothetical protein